MFDNVKFVLESDDFKKSQKGTIIQDFVVKIDGLTKAMYTVFPPTAFKKGVYVLTGGKLNAFTSNGFTNLQVRDPIFKLESELK